MVETRWFAVPATVIALAAACIQLGGVGINSIAYLASHPERRIDATITYERVRIPPAAEAILGTSYFHGPHLHAWVYVYLKNDTDYDAENVVVTMRDATVYSVPVQNELSSQVTTGQDKFRLAKLASGDEARVVYFVEDRPKFEDVQAITVTQNGAHPRIHLYGSIPTPFWHKRSVLVGVTFFDTLIVVWIYNWARKWRKARALRALSATLRTAAATTSPADH